jgi:sugar lactone lactonase YvrE
VIAGLAALFVVGVLGLSASKTGGLASSDRTSSDPALGTCPPSRDISSLPVFARTVMTEIPDDLTVDPSGNVWVTVEVQGHILEYTADGTLRRDLPDGAGPEGIIVTPDVTVVADQLQSRVDRLTSDGRILPFLKLPNPRHLLPVDGLGFDARRQRLLVPNSPAGTLLATPLTSPSPRLLASGLGRPVAASVGPDGYLYVAAESNVGLTRIRANGGAARRVGQLTNLDEVVTAGRLLYTTGAGDGTVRAVDPVTGANSVLVTGGSQLQGLTGLPDGRLLVISSATRTISVVSPCR